MHRSLAGLAIELYQAQQQGASYESAKRRLSLDLSTEDWARLDDVYNDLEEEGWSIINETTFTLTVPDRALLLAALRCLQAQMDRPGQRTFWRQDTELAKVATNEGMFSLPTGGSINELCGRISGIAEQFESAEVHLEGTHSSVDTREEAAC